MALAMQTHRAPTASSSTVTAPPGSTTPVVLKLRGASGKQGKAVEWTEETIDNEGMGRKKSKSPSLPLTVCFS